MISTDDRRNPLKHLTDTSGDEYPVKTLKVLYEYSQRGERGCAELLLKRFKDLEKPIWFLWGHFREWLSRKVEIIQRRGINLCFIQGWLWSYCYLEEEKWA